MEEMEALVGIVTFFIIVVIIVIFLSAKSTQIGVILLDENRSTRAGLSTPINTGLQEYIKVNNLSDILKYYYSDGTSENALELIAQAYNSGIRKIIGPITSQEIKGSVEEFISSHPDLIVVNGSATSPELATDIGNIVYFVPDDDLMITHLSGLIKLRCSDYSDAILIYRNDTWGNNYNSGVTNLLEKYLPNMTVTSYQYDYTSTESLNSAISLAGNKIGSSVKPLVVFLGLDEIEAYLTTVISDQRFLVKHFGTDGVAFNQSLLSDDERKVFAVRTEFESVFYYGHNSWSEKRYGFGKNYSGDSSMGSIELSTYTFTYYDALDVLYKSSSISEIKTLLKNYYGLSGYISLGSGNRRIYGSTHGIYIIHNGNEYIWNTASVVTNKLNIDDISTSKISDMSDYYDLKFDPNFSSYPVTVTFYDSYGYSTVYIVNDPTSVIHCPISNTVVVEWGEGSKIVIADAMGQDTMRSINGYVVRGIKDSTEFNDVVNTSSDLTLSQDGINVDNNAHSLDIEIDVTDNTKSLPSGIQVDNDMH